MMMANTVSRSCFRLLPFLGRKIIPQNGRRTFLSVSHTCNEAWEERKNTPVLKKVEVGDFALRIQERLDSGDVQALDMDLLANKLDELETQQLDFVQNLFYGFRHTQNAIGVPESLSHALVRALIYHNETDRLFEILNDKINYGIFLDDYSAIFLLNHFIKKEQWQEAAQVAFDMMLQEEFAHPLVRLLSLYACVRHWRNDMANPPEKAEETPAEEEEDQWIPVKFIRNPWYDDHWDMDRETLKLGKTMTMISAYEDSSLGHSFTLIGLGLHEHIPAGIKFLTEMAESGKDQTLAKEATASFMLTLEGIVTKEPPEQEIEPGAKTLEDVKPYFTAQQKEEYLIQTKECIARLEAQNQIIDMNLDEELTAKVKKMCTLLEQNDIDNQRTLYKSWEQDRQDAVDAQLEALRRLQQKEEIAKKLIELQQKEERLSYFEEKQRIMLGISRVPRIKPVVEVVEEEQFVAPPTERGRR